MGTARVNCPSTPADSAVMMPPRLMPVMPTLVSVISGRKVRIARARMESRCASRCASLFAWVALSAGLFPMPTEMLVCANSATATRASIEFGLTWKGQ